MFHSTAGCLAELSSVSVDVKAARLNDSHRCGHPAMTQTLTLHVLIKAD